MHRSARARTRRRFQRPAEIVIGYDEMVVDARAVAEARALWTATVPVRAMPFRRSDAHPAAALLVTLGDVGHTSPVAPPREACEALARCLADAGVNPLHLMVRCDIAGVIVRGDVRTHDPGAVAKALHDMPALIAAATEAIRTALPAGTHLVTAVFAPEETRWALTHAHGFTQDVWHRRYDTAAGWVSD